MKGEDRVQGQIELEMKRGCGKIEEREKKTVDDPEILEDIALPPPPCCLHFQLTPLREEIPKMSLVSNVTTSFHCSSGMKGVRGRENLEESALLSICGPPPERTEWSSAGRAQGLDLSAAV